MRKIGEGAFGAVYEAYLPGAMGFEKRIAIKRLRSHLVKGDQRFVRAMVNEAHIGALLHHSDIVDTIEFDQVDGVYYLAMEFVDGAIVDLMREVRKGLAYAHGLRDREGVPLNLIHRDLKPSNIIVLVEHSADDGLRDGDQVSLLSRHWMYLSAQPNGSLVADREAPGSWETFTLVNLDGGFVQPGDRIGLVSAHTATWFSLATGWRC